MENTSKDFAESVADATTLETQHSNFNLLAVSSTEPEDEDEDEDDNEKEDESEGGDKSKGSDDDNPPLDKDIVHSPLPPQTGGKPK